MWSYSEGWQTGKGEQREQSLCFLPVVWIKTKFCEGPVWHLGKSADSPSLKTFETPLKTDFRRSAVTLRISLVGWVFSTKRIVFLLNVILRCLEQHKWKNGVGAGRNLGWHLNRHRLLTHFLFFLPFVAFFFVCHPASENEIKNLTLTFLSSLFWSVSPHSRPADQSRRFSPFNRQLTHNTTALKH